MGKSERPGQCLVQGQNQKWLLHPAVSGSHMWEKWQHHPCLSLSRGSPRLDTGTKSEMATSPCRLRVPHVGKMATSPVPSRGSPRLGAGTKSACLLGDPRVGRMATSPLPSRGPHGGERSIWRHHPWLPGFSGSPWWGEINMATSPLPSQGPHSGERSIWLHHPWLLGVPMVGRN